jgi:peptide deformylase
MAVYPVLTEPNPLLHLVSQPVEEVDHRIRKLLDDMLETMYACQGIGLAAPQIGVLKRLVVIDLGNSEGPAQRSQKHPSPLKMINPSISWSSEVSQSFSEGCLSVPEHYVDIERPAQVRLSFLDDQGTPRELLATGLLAICVQHEIDHLNGITLLTHEAQKHPQRSHKTAH